MTHKTRKAGSAPAWVLLALCMAALAAGCVAAVRPQQRDSYAPLGRAASVEAVAVPTGGAFPINRMDAAGLTALPGIGGKLAQAIVDEREAHGPFYYPEDLLVVSGIGQGKLAGIRDLICLETEGETQP